MTTIRLGDVRAFGDVNGDGAEDAAVTMIADFGGSGTFTYLALVLNNKGVPTPLPAVLLGDRIIVNSIAIGDGDVVVHVLTRRPEEPMADPASVEATRTFRLQGEKLIAAN